MAYYNPHIIRPYDLDAAAYLSAAAITTSTQRNALTQLCVNLKNQSLWTKFFAIYPVLGGSAASHKFNLKDPRDLDAAFRLVFNGTWTHSSTGMLPNGTNAYAATKFIPSSSGFTTSSGHFSYYSRTNNTAAVIVEMGAINSSGIQNSLFAFYSGNIMGCSYGSNAGALTAAATRSDSLFVVNRNGATNDEMYRVTTRTINAAQTAGLSTVEMYLAAQNNQGTAEGFTNRECAFATIGQGLSTTEETNLYNIIQIYQTALGRAV
jgi:hypothetical protein